MQPLANEVSDRVLNVAGLPRIPDSSGRSVRQSQPLIACIEKNWSPIEPGMGLVELQYHRTAKQGPEQNTLSHDILCDDKASFEI